MRVEIVLRFEAYCVIDLKFAFSDKLTDTVKSIVDADKDPCRDRKSGTTKFLDFVSSIFFKV